MPFLVRKLNKRDQFSKLVEKECVEDIYADIPTCEFRTTKGCLSTWLIENLEDIDNAVLAIAVSSIGDTQRCAVYGEDSVANGSLSEEEPNKKEAESQKERGESSGKNLNPLLEKGTRL